MKLTISLIKADVGSIGGHTRPSQKMLATVQEHMRKAVQDKLLIDGFVSFTGDDIALLMSHTNGKNDKDVHQFVWRALCAAAKQAHADGLYGAGQDLLVDAPSSNVRGAGPGVAEIEFNHTLEGYRPAESFLMLAADKCGPGAFNLPLFLAFADPMYCAGLMLPKMSKGFVFTIIDMDNAKGDSVLELNSPDDYYNITALLRDNERFGIDSIHSRNYDGEQVAAISAQRLHTIAGKYTGKDDPVALIRTQSIFPAPEEIIMPFTKAHYVGGDARGSHVMPLMPVPLNTAVTGPYCLPIIACVAFSVAKNGTFCCDRVDMFDNPAWDVVRHNAQKKALEMRSQGWSGAAMLPYNELEYSGFKDTITGLIKQFGFRNNAKKR